MDDENDSGRIFDTAVQIRNARQASRSVDTFLGSMRLALEKVQPENIETVRQLHDEMVELQQKTAETLLSLTMEISDLVAVLTAVKPVVVNVPETVLQLEQQPVTVNVPKATPVQVNPVINVPPAQVVIDKPASNVPKRAMITHSDGTTSTVEFGK